jgi:hypothetical protein
MRTVPFWVILIPVVAVICDSVVVIAVAMSLHRAIKQTKTDLETEARLSIQVAAKDIKGVLGGVLTNFGIILPDDDEESEIRRIG